MKKTYSTPHIVISPLRIKTPFMTVVTSYVLDSSDGNKLTSSNDILVKGNNYSSPHYNVWDDDWSK